jgi:hypothetical protein
VRRVQRVEEWRVGVWRGVRATSGGCGRYEKAVVFKGESRRMAVSWR